MKGVALDPKHISARGLGYLPIEITEDGFLNTSLIRLATKPLAVVEMAAGERDAFLATLKERPEAERLLAAVAAAADPKARLAAVDALRLHLFREAEAILIQDGLPVIPLYFYVVTGLVHPRVEGFHARVKDVDGSMIPNLQDLHPFRDVRMRGPAGAPK